MAAHFERLRLDKPVDQRTNNPQKHRSDSEGRHDDQIEPTQFIENRIKSGTLTPTHIQALQRTHGNRFVQRLISQTRQASPVLAANASAVQRMKITGQDKVVADRLKERYLTARPNDYDGWNTLVREARDIVDLTAKVDRIAPQVEEEPVEEEPGVPFGEEDLGGKMDETDAQQLAEYYGWIVETAPNFVCSDRKHTPKGRVYTDGKGNYWGADNSGHVGFSFKYWTGSPRSLTYRGNTRHHSPFDIIPRGS